MASMQSIRGAFIAAIAMVLLAGCTPTTTAEPSPTLTAVETPSPTPTPESTVPPVPTKPRVSDLIITPDGLGPLTLGEAPPETTPALDVLVWDADYCKAEKGPGQWVPNYPKPFPFEVAVRDDVVSRIDVWMGPIATATGIRRGSSLAALLKAYPDGFTAVNTAGHTSDVYIINGRVGQLLIEVATDDRLPGYWEPGDVDHVMFVRSTLLTDSPSPISGSDNVIGGCPPPA
jgi:hypothetical protein